MPDGAVLGAGLTVIVIVSGLLMYVVRSETQQVRNLVILDRETVKLRLTGLEESVLKMSKTLEAVIDYKWQIKLMEERVQSQGRRLDAMSIRFNYYVDAKLIPGLPVPFREELVEP